MDKRTVEARVERLFKEAKPKPRSNKKGYLKLAAALILAAIPLSITQQPSSTPMPENQLVSAVAETKDPTIKPSVLADSDQSLTILVTKPSTVFFCGCAHTRYKSISAFAPPHQSSDI